MWKTAFAGFSLLSCSQCLLLPELIFPKEIVEWTSCNATLHLLQLGQHTEEWAFHPRDKTTAHNATDLDGWALIVDVVGPQWMWQGRCISTFVHQLFFALRNKRMKSHKNQVKKKVGHSWQVSAQNPWAGNSIEWSLFAKFEAPYCVFYLASNAKRSSERFIHKKFQWINLYAFIDAGIKMQCTSPQEGDFSRVSIMVQMSAKSDWRSSCIRPGERYWGSKDRDVLLDSGGVLIIDLRTHSGVEIMLDEAARQSRRTFVDPKKCSPKTKPFYS